MEQQTLLFFGSLAIAFICSITVGFIISVIVWAILDAFLVAYWESQRAVALAEYEGTIYTSEMADQIVAKHNPFWFSFMNAKDSYFIFLWLMIQCFVWALSCVAFIIYKVAG